MTRAFARLILSLLTGSLWRWPLALLRWIAASPARIWAALFAIALALAGWQAHRAANWEDTARNTQTTLNNERNATHAARAAYQAQSKKDAAHADTNHTALASGATGRFADYAAGHRMPPNAPAHRADAGRTNDPAIPEIPAPDAIMAEISRVWITRSDWLTCDADWAYAQAAHDWAQRVGQ